MNCLHSLVPLVRCIAFAITAGVAFSINSFAQTASAPPVVNLALAAEPDSSYTSGDTSLAALNDGLEPGSSRDRRRGSYGNWNRTGTQWVEYTWSKPITTDRIEVYWWADGQGIHLPEASRLLEWDGEKYVNVPGAQQIGLAGNQFNVAEFEPVTTTKLRLEIDSAGRNSTGILEWRVLDNGDSPAFPPIVEGDVDRIVMLGGKTYLNGKVKSVSEPEPQVQWSKQSGPGSVEFEDANAIETSATFSEVGDYKLKLTASNGEDEASALVSVKVELPPDVEPLGVVYTRRYKIDNPLWNDRAKALITAWIPHCIDRINRPDLREGGINNFEEAAKKLAGQSAEPHRGYVFANAWVHQTVESMCIALMVDPQGDEEIIAAQEQMKETLDDWIPKILAAQEPDGYMQTAFTLNDRMNRWTPRNRQGHEGYTAGYFIESAINHYTLTNGTDRRLYDAAKKLADCWVANIGPEPGKQPWYDEHQEMEQALVRFGRFVNDMEGSGAGDDYINLAKFLLDCRGGGSEYDQSHRPVQQQYQAVGHAVRAVYLYSGMADVATETGDLDYRSAVMSLWDNITNRQYYITGGIGSGETSEGFGGDYSLPNSAYCESCSSCGEIFFQYKMNLSYHDAKYVDLYEETFYNALLGSLDMPGRNFYYQNPLNSGRPRYPWHVCPCCVGNIPRTLLMLPTWTYTKDDDGVYVNLFIGGTTTIEGVKGQDVVMVQETNYPWDGTVKLTVNPPDAMDLAIRIRSPQRSVSSLYTCTPAADGIESMKVNGESIEFEVNNGYVTVDRTWQPGDTLEFELPMTPQRVKCSDLVEANRGRVALKYGPLIYNIESIDGNPMDGVLLPEADLTTEWRSDLLGGVVVIKSEFADGTPLLAIPNYARNNRYPENAEEGPRRRRSGNQSIVWIRDE